MRRKRMQYEKIFHILHSKKVYVLLNDEETCPTFLFEEKWILVVEMFPWKERISK